MGNTVSARKISTKEEGLESKWNTPQASVVRIPFIIDCTNLYKTYVTKKNIIYLLHLRNKDSTRARVCPRAKN